MYTYIYICIHTRFWIHVCTHDIYMYAHKCMYVFVPPFRKRIYCIQIWTLFNTLLYTYRQQFYCKLSTTIQQKWTAFLIIYIHTHTHVYAHLCENAAQAIPDDSKSDMNENLNICTRKQIRTHMYLYTCRRKCCWSRFLTTTMKKWMTSSCNSARSLTRPRIPR